MPDAEPVMTAVLLPSEISIYVETTRLVESEKLEIFPAIHFAKSSTASAITLSYAARATSYALAASAFSSLRICGSFFFQQTSTASRHHWAERLLARIGLPSISTKMGFVWQLGKMRSATQLECLGV